MMQQAKLRHNRAQHNETTQQKLTPMGTSQPRRKTSAPCVLQDLPPFPVAACAARCFSNALEEGKTLNLHTVNSTTMEEIPLTKPV